VIQQQGMRIDPRMFISGPFIECPRCGKPEFGVLMIGGNGYTRRCRECWFDQRFPLPALKKRIIYLDQFLISNITKALDSESKGHARVLKQPFWLDAFKKLDRLLKLHLIACPDSLAHRDESLMSGDPPFELLNHVYEHLSHGTTFWDHDTIIRFQMYHCFTAYLDGGTPKLMEADEVVHGRLHEWHDRLRISMRSFTGQDEIDRMRASRDRGYEELAGVFETWGSQQRDRSFQDRMRDEAEAFGRGIGESYGAYLGRWQRLNQEFAAGMTPDSDAAFLDAALPPPAFLIVRSMREELEKRGITGEASFTKVGEYLRSPDLLLEVPYVHISTMLFAAIARKAASGQLRPPSKGTFTDVRTIASLLPYCDAMFLDAEMAGFVGEEPLRTETVKYKTQVFSVNTKEEFLAYLNGVEEEAGADHAQVVRQVYGDDWLAPYLSLVEDHKRRHDENAR